MLHSLANKYNKTILLSFIVLLHSIQLIAQPSIEPSQAITIHGNIKKIVVITMDDLEQLESRSIPNIVIYNHKGEARDTLRQVRGIRLKEVLAMIQFDYKQAKDLNTCYLVLEATDHYKVLYSWNELFNSTIGDGVYILTHVNGYSLRKMPQRIACISLHDQLSGRRYVQGLQQIIVAYAP